jgi:hypothetical protein
LWSSLKSLISKAYALHGQIGARVGVILSLSFWVLPSIFASFSPFRKNEK